MFKFGVFFVFSFICATVFAQPWQVTHSLLPNGTQLSYLVVDAKSNKTLARFQADTLRTPASVQKLLTATAATLYLGANYRYQTTIQGNRSAILKGRFTGDLRFYFTGDPTLTRQHIRSMLYDLKGQGIKHIDGNVLLNSSRFNGYQWSDGQAWNDLGVCYTAPSNAIIINHNCVLGNLSLAKKNAKKATLFIPRYEPINISSDVSVVTKAQQKAQSCALELNRESHNNYQLVGCMLPRKHALPLAFSVNDPAHYAAQIITAELAKVGIQFSGKVISDHQTPSQGVQSVLVSHQSPKLDNLLSVMMKESDNLIADSLFKTMGSVYFKQPGNFRNGTKALKAILKAQGLDLSEAYIADGSGLSRHNLMSASLFMSVLQFVYARDQQLHLLDTFSVSGVDGTLKYHKGVNSAALKGKVRAKTGSLKGVANLLGVVKSEAGDRLFVLMVNGYHAAVKAGQKKQAVAPLYLFERAFFQQIATQQ